MSDQNLLDDKGAFPEKPKVYTGELAGLAWKLEQAEDNIKIARKILYALAGLIILGSLLSMAMSKSFSLFVFIPALVIASFYGVCGYISQQRPVLGLGLALGAYLVYVLIMGLLIPLSLAQGVIWKIVIILSLSFGIYNAVKGTRLKREIQKAEAEMRRE